MRVNTCFWEVDWISRSPAPETAAGIRVKATAASVIDTHRGELVRKKKQNQLRHRQSGKKKGGLTDNATRRLQQVILLVWIAALSRPTSNTKPLFFLPRIMCFTHAWFTPLRCISFAQSQRKIKIKKKQKWKTPPLQLHDNVFAVSHSSHSSDINGQILNCNVHAWAQPN